MNAASKRIIFAGLAAIMLISLLGLPCGCGGPGKPTLMSFTGKNNESAQKMKPIVDKLKKKYKDRVIFKDINMDDPKNKGIVNEYHVSMNPTFIILNTEGKVKETFMGAAQEEMLAMAVEGFIPEGKKPPGSSAPSAPGQNQPVPTPPPSTTPSTVQTIPAPPTK